MSIDKTDLVRYLEEFTVKMVERLDQKRKQYGDTWRIRGLVFNGKSQEDRFMDWVDNKYNKWIENDEPFPWVDIANEALIGYVRENKDDWQMEVEDDREFSD